MNNQEIEKALRTAFPSYASLERMLSHQLDINLEEIVEKGSLEDVVFRLVERWAEPHQKVRNLLEGARREIPENEDLLQAEKHYLESIQVAGIFFLCYSSEDCEAAQQLRTELEYQGFSIWRDQDSVKPGAHFPLELEQAIRRANSVIALVSNSSRESVWVQNELQFALDLQKPIIPVIIEQKAKLPIIIYSFQYIDLTRDRNMGLRKLGDKLMGNVHETQSRQLENIPALKEVAPISPDKNPFIYGNRIPADLFFGRNDALQAIRERVGNYSDLQSISVVSNRRMGKSSLLNYVFKKPEIVFSNEHSYALVYIDAMDPRAHSIKGFMRLLRLALVKQIGQNLWDEQDDGNLFKLTEAFQKLAEEDEIRLVLLLDEWEEVMAYAELTPLLEALRTSGARSWIGMITATAHSLAKLQESGKISSPFSNIFHSYYLGNFPENEWRELVRQAFYRSGLKCDESILTRVGYMSGGHPYLVQLAGSLLWKEACGMLISNQVLKEFKKQAMQVYAAIVQVLPQTELHAVHQLAKRENINKIPQGVLDELCDKGIVINEYSLFSEHFREYILNELRS